MIRCPHPEAPAYPNRRIAKKALERQKRQGEIGKISKVYQCKCASWHIENLTLFTLTLRSSKPGSSK